MAHTLTKAADVPHVSKIGIEINVYPDTDQCGVVLASTEKGHNQEFYHRVSTFTYIVLEGSGMFYLDDVPVEVETGDMISIQPNTRIYYTGTLKLALITTPAWTEEEEVTTKESIW